MRSGIIAKKVGMTRLFDEDGRHIPVTVLEISNCQVTQVKTEESDGYSSVQLGAFNQKQSRVSKPLQGHFAKAKVEPKKSVVEFRTEADHGFEVGAEVKADHFQTGQFVDIAGITNGKGFAGGMKRWNFGGMRASHGVSVSHRAHGSVGQCQDPGKVFKGKKMAGQMGNKRRTQQNLKVVRIDMERNVILVRGSVPGSKGCVVEVRDAVKKPAPAAQN